MVKRVEEGQYLLKKTSVNVNGKKNGSEEINNLLSQKPNNTLLGFPLRLHIYNLARPDIDSILHDRILSDSAKVRRRTNLLSKKQFDRHLQSKRNFNSWLKETGEAPVIIDSLRILRTSSRLENYYFANGWFQRQVTFDVETNKDKIGSVDFFVETGNPFILDSLTTDIYTDALDSIYKSNKKNSHIIQGNQFRYEDFDNEIERVTSDYRNSGVYHFSRDYIQFEQDTNDTKYKVNTKLLIKNRIIRTDESETTEPFKIYKIRDVNIITDETFENRNTPYSDSLIYEGYNLYSHGKMRFKPKALTDAVLITKDDFFKEIDRTRTYRYLNELRTFKYPGIDYVENQEDTTLTANIRLTPRKKYALGFEVNVSQSNIQSVGFSFNTSLITRNIFRGAETLEVSFLGALGASKDGAEDSNQFFDINELGADVKLTIPRIFFPFNTEKIIPKYMSPSTRISLGLTSQTNIGLDKQTINGAFKYNWLPSETTRNIVDLFNVQYIRNLNPGNYFSVYQNSFGRLEDIAINTYNTPVNFIGTDANGNPILMQDYADEFITTVLEDSGFESSNSEEYQTVNNIKERKDRLTEDNLIFASSFTYEKDKRESIIDTDFSKFRAKLELAGNTLANVSKLLGIKKNLDGRYEILNVAYSQYIKTELDYVKYWNLGGKNVLAMRSFFGIAIPYGNSNSIPFSKSFFAGGTNDNRAWTAYNLGPGSSDSRNEFNEANMKIALSFEYRYNMFGRFNGAFFVDAGNIWNVLDDVEDNNARFNDLASLKDIAIGTGFGIRYDFGLFVLRGDIGFKTYDPSYLDENRWLNNYNFSNAVYNIGINYPF